MLPSNLRAPQALASASLFVALLAPAAQSDLTYSDFTTPFGVQFLGDAHVASTQLRLTNNASNENGAGWFTTAQKVSTPWVAEFEFQLVGGPGADGFAFVIQNNSTNAIGGNGCELAYHGIPNSVAIEFDTYDNGGSCGVGTVNDLNAPHISVHTQGTSPNSVNEAASIGATTAVPAYSDGNIHTARIMYVPGTLFVFVDDLVNAALTVPLDLPSTLSLTNDRAWLGFTGATGGLSESHDILNFLFDEDSTGTGTNTPPAQPQITEPELDGQIVNPADVHMETSAFVDADPGDMHLCTDYEIWRTSPPERIWITSCISGVTSVHSHLGDGVFENSHAGFHALLPGTQYLLRVRHRDDSGESLTEWSPWRNRNFITGSASDTFPLETEEIEDEPAPTWSITAGGAPVILPGGGTPPSLSIDNPVHGLLLQISGLDGVNNVVLNPPPLSEHAEFRIHVTGGTGGLFLPETDLVVYDHDCIRAEILLPALNVAPGQNDYFWVSAEGATYHATSSQNSPNFNNQARGLDLPWSVKQAGYEVEVFAEGFKLPVNIAFIPNAGPEPTAPFFYVTELYGDIRVVKRDGSVGTYATGLLDFNPTGAFPGSGEQGLAGIAIDPATGDLYVSVLHDSVTNPGTHYPKVVRFTSNDGGLTAATETTILDMVGESQGQSHQISNVTFMPDGKLLVHMGDGFNSATAQNMDSYRGKILRMNLDGSAVSSNPFYNAGNGINSRDYIWAYGVRNPFGGAWRALDGLQYTVENGPSIDRIGQVVAGRNFGWSGSNSSMLNHALYVWDPSHGPVNIAFIQQETFGGSGFPADKMDHAFVSESGPTYGSGGQAKGKRISEFVFDASGTLVTGPIPFLEYGGLGQETSVGLAAGPDGLYMTSLYRDQGFNPTATGARVYRVSRIPGWDCNENGIDDACDIASGVEMDANSNGLPDSCECGGVTFCAASVNSTGSPATISSNGQCVVSANQFALQSQSVPNGLGVFFFGAGLINGGQGQPFYNGVRCVGPAVSRLPVVVAAGGVADYQLDMTTAPASQIQPGQTWHFQYWYRDVAGGGALANVSEALSVTFQ
jgi:glucose/arabinose dehydrogenase